MPFILGSELYDPAEDDEEEEDDVAVLDEVAVLYVESASESESEKLSV